MLIFFLKVFHPKFYFQIILFTWLIQIYYNNFDQNWYNVVVILIKLA